MRYDLERDLAAIKQALKELEPHLPRLGEAEQELYRNATNAIETFEKGVASGRE